MKKLATLLTSGMMYLVPQAVNAQAVEHMAANGYSTLDTKLPYTAGPVNLFARNRLTFGEGVSTINFVDAGIPIGGGFSASGEARITDEVNYRLGFEFYQELGNFSVYAFPTRSTSGSNYEFFGRIKHKTETWLGELEGIVNSDFNILRVRAGINWKGYSIGPALDLYQDSKTTSTHVGVAVRKEL